MYKKLLLKYKENGLRVLIIRILYKLFPQKSSSIKLCKNLLQYKSGLEIGGPSVLFSRKGILPIYPHIKSLDNCNFSSKTIWEGQIESGFTFKFDKAHPEGRQYILEAAELDKIQSAHYDFILSSHVLEHVANPIKALLEWIRVLKEDGVLIIVLPHKDGTFDHKREITTLAHLLEDYDNNTSEYDLTHLDEILKLHDLTRDLPAGSYDQFKIRSQHNFENRCLHHHVFNTPLAVKLIDSVGLKIISVEALLPSHIIIVSTKTKKQDNSDVFNKFIQRKFKSLFISDKYY